MSAVKFTQSEVAGGEEAGDDPPWWLGFNLVWLQVLLITDHLRDCLDVLVQHPEVRVEAGGGLEVPVIRQIFPAAPQLRQGLRLATFYI